MHPKGPTDGSNKIKDLACCRLLGGPNLDHLAWGRSAIQRHMTFKQLLDERRSCPKAVLLTCKFNLHVNFVGKGEQRSSPKKAHKSKKNMAHRALPLP